MAESSAAQGTPSKRGVVAAKCDDATAPGHWYCITHDAGFPHNMALASHIEDSTIKGEHVIAWDCSAHGPEVP